MAHQISIEASEVVLSGKDTSVVVKKDGKKLGTLLLSKGNLEWLPRGNSVNKYRITWSTFAEWMESDGKPVKIRSSK